MLAFALYTQYYENLEPCPLCIFQRITVVALGIAFLAAAIHDPRGVAARSMSDSSASWQWLRLASRAGTFTYKVSRRAAFRPAAPPQRADADVPHLAGRGEGAARRGECAVVNWTLWGVSMPGWVLFCALILGGAGIIANLPRRPPTLLMR